MILIKSTTNQSNYLNRSNVNVFDVHAKAFASHACMTWVVVYAPESESVIKSLLITIISSFQTP